MKIIQSNKTESGQSLVELAVSIVILLILLAGVVDLGRVAYYYIAMRDTAQEAASYAAIFPHKSDEILKRAVAGMNGLIDPSHVIYRIYHTGSGFDYECVWENPDTATYSNLPSCGKEQNVTDYSVYDVIEITIQNNEFPITMPFLATLIGADNQSISLESVVQDVVMRVPNPSPTP